MMITGITSAGSARTKARATSPRGARATRWPPIRPASSQTIAISTAVISSPGTSPAMNSSPTDAPVIELKITIRMLGGMIGPRIAADATITTEYGSS